MWPKERTVQCQIEALIAPYELIKNSDSNIMNERSDLDNITVMKINLFSLSTVIVVHLDVYIFV